MKTRSTAILLLLSTTPAAAHYGHLVDLAGHAHWIGLGAATAAVAIAAAIVKQRKSSDAADAPPSDTEETEEAAS